MEVLNKGKRKVRVGFYLRRSCGIYIVRYGENWPAFLSIFVCFYFCRLLRTFDSFIYMSAASSSSIYLSGMVESAEDVVGC